MATCRTCEAPIVWALTAKGKDIPVDEKPVDDGNLVLVDDTIETDRGPQKVKRARSPDALLEAGLPRYKSHFATCPDAEEHRRR